ncbi:MAG: glycosyltransferase [Rhodobacteraceae bacterium]|nr:glycosyltransferase [Paracoccaceae bacterium]
MSIRRQSGGLEFGREPGSDARSRERKLSKRIWDRIGLSFGAKSGARGQRAGQGAAKPASRPTAQRAEALAKLLLGSAADQQWTEGVGDPARLGRVRPASTNLEAARAASTWAAQFAALITSDAFRRHVLTPIAFSEPTTTAEAEPAPPQELLAAAVKKVDAALEPLWVAAALDRFKGPFASWGAFWGELLALEGVRWAAEQGYDPEARAKYLEDVSRARAMLLAAPGSAVVVSVDVDTDKRRGGDGPRVVVKTRVFGAGPRQLNVRARRVSDGAVVGHLDVTSPEGAIGGVEMATVLPFAHTIDLSAGMMVEVAASRRGEPLGPGGRISADFSDAAWMMTRRQIDSVLAAGDWDGAEQMIDAAISRTPTSAAPRVVAVEMALWRRNLERATALLKAADAPADAEWVRLEAALAAARTPELLSPSAEAAALSPAALGAEIRAALTPLAAARLAAAPAGPRAAAVSMLSATPAALLACAARLDPGILPWLSAEWALAVARTAVQQDQHAAALAWAGAAMNRGEVSPEVQDAVIMLCGYLDTPAAVSSALRYARDETALQSEPRKALYIASLEARLCEIDPSKDRTPLLQRLETERAAVEQGAKSSDSEPFDPSQAIYLAEARTLTNDLRGAVDLLTKLVAQAPGDLSRRLTLLAALEQLDAPERVIETAEPVLFDETAFLFHIRALRASGQVETAVSALTVREQKDPSPSSLELRLEKARAYFQLGEFAMALTASEAALAVRPGSRVARRLAVSSAIEVGAHDLDVLERGAAHLEAWESIDPITEPADAIPTGDQLDIPLFRAALAHAGGDVETGLGQFNALWRRLGLREVGLRPNSASYAGELLAELIAAPNAAVGRMHGGEGPDIFDPDELPPPPRAEGPLVSVVMTTHNAAGFLRTALSSVFAQSYQNLEVIAVDDASTDSSLDMLRAWAAEEPRLQVVARAKNEGAFVARNAGLEQATGAYLAFQDADDWSHPDRLARCVALLEARPNLVAVTADSIRVDGAARPLIRPNAEITAESWSSLVCRRDQTMARVGFFDSVRAEADEDYLRRLELAFGRWAVARLREPLLLARVHPSALNADVAIGVTRAGPGTFRRAYRSAAARWRDEIAAGRASARLSFPLETRPFKVPAALTPGRD